jgi:peptidyl-prolyl cis-trans isomerase SurA
MKRDRKKMFSKSIDAMRGLLNNAGVFCIVLAFPFTGMCSPVTPAGGDSIVDGIIAVVGSSAILKSDIENQYIQLRQQGSISGSAPTVKCQIFENMLFQKLLLNQAQVDSIKVTDAQVENEMDRRMRYFISLEGSPEKLEERFQKSLVEIKNELHDMIREQMLTEQAQQKITKDVNITPEEVKSYFRKLPKDSIPEVNSQMEIGFISRQPVISEEEKNYARGKLTEIRGRVLKGDDFSTLAVLYSEDPGSAKKGGELGMFKRGDMRPEFEAAAFRLKPNEISDIVETEDGMHLIQMIERRGEYINVRHILIQPKVSPLTLTRLKSSLDSVALDIENKKITFEDAVLKYSDDPNKNNGGLMINYATNNSRFEADEIDPKVFFVIDKLKVGETSSPVIFKSERGKEEYRIYYLKSRSSPHKANLNDDYLKIQEQALAKKKEKAIDAWIVDKVSKTYILILDHSLNCKFQKNWTQKSEK